jgi:hypothetical protein
VDIAHTIDQYAKPPADPRRIRNLGQFQDSSYPSRHFEIGARIELQFSTPTRRILSVVCSVEIAAHAGKILCQPFSSFSGQTLPIFQWGIMANRIVSSNISWSATRKTLIYREFSRLN